jgi:very-short-patch-repair endonuclease
MDSRKIVHNKSKLKENRRELRSNLTSAEAFLWSKLSGNKLEGRKFRRQHSVGNYVLDFYCPSEKLAVELDGMMHFTEDGLKRDENRTAYLNLMGINVLRFENAEVFDYTEEVLNKIKNCFKK